MASPSMNNKRYCLNGQPTDIFAEMTFGASGAPTLTTTNDKSRGVKALLQAKASSKIYMLTLNDKWVDLKMATALVSSLAASHQASVGAIQRLSESSAVGGGVAVICPASAAAGDTVTLKKPGSTAVTLTGVAYDATPGDNEFCVGNGSAADSESANNIAAVIRNDSDDSDQAGKGTSNGNGGSTTMPSGITAYAVGGVAIISTTEPGWQIQTSHATKLAFKATGTGVANTAQIMDPGLVFQFEDTTSTLTSLTDNGGGATADGTIAVVTAPTAIGATLTDNTGLAGSHDDTLAATTVPADLTGGESPTEAEHNAVLALLRVMAQNESDLAQKAIELVTAQGADRTAIVALTDAVKELSTKINSIITAMQAAPASGDRAMVALTLENATRTV